MANRNKGEYEFKVDGKSYVLRFSADSICDLEGSLGMTINQVGAQMQNAEELKMTTIRAMFFAGLSDHHGDLDESARKALFKTLGPIEAVSVVSRAFALAFDVGDTAESGGENPLQPGEAASGTGPASTPTGWL